MEEKIHLVWSEVAVVIGFLSYSPALLSKIRLIFLFTLSGLWVGQTRVGQIFSTGYISICFFPLAGTTKREPESGPPGSKLFRSTCSLQLVLLQFPGFYLARRCGLGWQSPGAKMVPSALRKWWHSHFICFNNYQKGAVRLDKISALECTAED